MMQINRQRNLIRSTHTRQSNAGRKLGMMNFFFIWPIFGGEELRIFDVSRELLCRFGHVPGCVVLTMVSLLAACWTGSSQQRIHAGIYSTCPYLAFE